MMEQGKTRLERFPLLRSEPSPKGAARSGSLGKAACRGFAATLALVLAGCGEGQQAPPAVRNLDPAQVTRGEALYNTHCAACHGPRGVGLPGDWRQRGPDGMHPPPPLDDSAHAWHHPTEVLRRMIRKGSPPGMGNMPAWEGKLGEREIEDVIVYIKSLWSDEIYAVWRQIEIQSMSN
jgi:mono/diheme cytochrome c family protein